MKQIVQLIARLLNTEGTELLNEQVPPLRSTVFPQQYYFLSPGDVSTPLGLPLKFELGSKEGLKIYSAGVLMLQVWSPAPYAPVVLRLPTDELLEVVMYDRDP
jgi:hypothetical protein